ncbi:MAG: HlyU family transcriptional regulator [Xanthobacteraceae bacterium]
MLSKLKAIWDRLASATGTGESADPPAAAVDYKGYRIRPIPYRTDGHYQTAGIIEKDGPERVREHRFVRADMHPSRDGAIAFTIAKAQQIIDLEGDRIFKS